MSKKKKKNRKKTKIEKSTIILSIILLAFITISYIVFGLELTAIIGGGILLILGVARLLDKVKSKPKRRRIINILLIIFLSIAI